AVVLSLASYERLLAGDTLEQEDWWTALERVRNLIQAELGDRELPPVEDVIREMREERDAQLDAAIGDLRGRKPRRPSRRSSDRIPELWRQWRVERREFAAPLLLRYEVVNALHRYQQQGLLSGPTIRTALREVLSIPIVLHTEAELHERAMDVAARFALPAA